jgi:hypothetical protein
VLAVYTALALGWVGFASWVVQPLLVAERPGPIVAAIAAHIRNVPVAFLTQDTAGCWREFASAALIAMALHLTIVVILLRHDSAAPEGESRRETRAGRPASIVLSIVSLAFLAVTVASRVRQDYFFYLQIWYEVRQRHDPWFLVNGESGLGPLNAYGPLFNPLAALAWANPLAPKLLFAYAYILFAVIETKRFIASRSRPVLGVIALFFWFWNPFAWVEIAYFGHFDTLVGLCCVAAIRAWVRREDRRSGIWLGLGVLLKYLPIVLLPFLAHDRCRLRVRFLAVAVGVIVCGLGLACGLWGIAALRPLTFAASRPSTTLSIFRYFRGSFSPLLQFGVPGNFDYLAPLLLCLGLLRAWSWSRVRRPNIEAVAVIAVATTLLFYRVGYPQYQMVSFVLASSWALRHWDELAGRRFLLVTMGCYFGWLAAFDVYYSIAEAFGPPVRGFDYRDVAGLPTFVLGCAFIAGLVRSSAPAVDRVADHTAARDAGVGRGSSAPD